MLTAARPKMAPYPFTTLHVNVGVIEYPETHGRIFMADIPGLIEGAHENRGLGHQFLRHIERCTLLVFIIDMAGSENRKPWDDHRILERELRLYSPVLATKPRIIVANKMDLPKASENLILFKQKVKDMVIPISCYTREGVDEFLAKLWKAVKGSPADRPKPPVLAAITEPKKKKFVRAVVKKKPAAKKLKAKKSAPQKFISKKAKSAAKKVVRPKVKSTKATKKKSKR
jgi:GTP-binding protein